ncbi:MAG: CoA-binding protein [Candidatus Lokiarchaeota archaeon]|nr:CoA-binding protein [Candidatus Lokiarchaeota archaeon]
MDIKKLDYIFKPKNMAVVGVSLKNPLFAGNIIYNKNLFEYPVNIVAINPSGGYLEGNEVYKKLEDVSIDLDLVVLMIKAKMIPEAMTTCGEVGVKSVIIGAGGFSEKGEEGKDLEKELLKISEKYDLPFMGPNCIGIHSKYCNTFILPSERLATPPMGNVAVISQSGGFLIDQIFSKFHERQIGIFAAANIGNKAQITENTLLKYFSKEPDVHSVVLYSEGFKENSGKELVKFAKESDKDIIIIKGGKSKFGARAAMSHTASIASNSNLISSSFQQAGIIEAVSENELVSFTKAISFGLSELQGDLVILSISGGHGVLAADLAAYYKLNLVEFTPQQKEELLSKVNPVIREIGTFENPIDLTGSVADTDVENCLETILSFDSVKGVVILLVPYVPTITMQIGRRLSNVVRNQKTKKPVIAYCPWLSIYGIIINGLELNRTIPVAHTIEDAIQMMRGLYLKGLNSKKR